MTESRAMTSFTITSASAPRTASRISSFAMVAFAHVIVIYVLTLSQTRVAITNASAFMVTLLHEQPLAKQKASELPKPRTLKTQSIAIESIRIPEVNANSQQVDVTTAPSETPQRPAAVASIPASPAEVEPPKFDAEYLENPAPAYPALSRRMGEQGRVIVRVFVDANGAANHLEIKTSSGSQRLDAAALDAVRRWKFLPAKQ
ncbi:MAG: TonB family protein, partial [Usitatibacteraceae bacterium]